MADFLGYQPRRLAAPEHDMEAEQKSFRHLAVRDFGFNDFAASLEDEFEIIPFPRSSPISALFRPRRSNGLWAAVHIRATGGSSTSNESVTV